ncbi:MAG: hypothetical protein JZU62_07200 [Sulfuricurvum sp.]|uniref:hypothetical protein n=1 Tax=Sulfuricurvum sp. TaxID=2025608 RepID=UPI0025EB8528|nr:hypothetical protein [Sulfuricurvum sp.]MBV5321454.1 hypothetical protein [Sulfuricurvum sp.]
MRHSLTLSLALLIFGGCAANKTGVTPSQNTNLQAVSPSATATAEGGAMQRSLDSWLKEEWNPMTAAPAVSTKTAVDGTVVTTKTEGTQVITTTTAPNGTVVTKTEPVVQEAEDNSPITLQKYADKWKAYHDKKAAMKEGQLQEPSHVEKMKSLPVIGK